MQHGRMRALAGLVVWMGLVVVGLLACDGDPADGRPALQQQAAVNGTGSGALKEHGVVAVTSERRHP